MISRIAQRDLLAVDVEKQISSSECCGTKCSQHLLKVRLVVHEQTCGLLFQTVIIFIFHSLHNIIEKQKMVSPSSIRLFQRSLKLQYTSQVCIVIKIKLACYLTCYWVKWTVLEETAEKLQINNTAGESWLFLD